MTTPPVSPPSSATGTTNSSDAASHEADLALVRRILDGDEAAWRYFVERYAGLILAMSRRYLHSRDIDDAGVPLGIGKDVVLDRVIVDRYSASILETQWLLKVQYASGVTEHSPIRPEW